MRVLLIKTSSMGDVIHTLPALSDAGEAIPDITFDWVVEEPFVEIPLWHPRVAKIIPVALRRWRRGLLSRQTWTEWACLRKQLSKVNYDLILDAQGLVKSSFLTFFAKGIRSGLDFHSAREALASFAYQQKHKVNFYQHAIVRMRSLFSLALGYHLPNTQPDFGIDLTQFEKLDSDKPYVVFLHGTTWKSKQWPETYWIQLSHLVNETGLQVKMSGGNDEEVARSERIAQGNPWVEVLPRLGIAEMANLIANAKVVIGVDTGFGHLAAALNVPTISLYGSTNPAYTGALGSSSIHLAAKFACSPCLKRDCTYHGPSAVKPACFESLSPELVWQEVKKLII